MIRTNTRSVAVDLTGVHATLNMERVSRPAGYNQTYEFVRLRFQSRPMTRHGDMTEPASILVSLDDAQRMFPGWEALNP